MKLIKNVTYGTKAIQYEPAGCEALKLYVRDLENGKLDPKFPFKLSMLLAEEKFDGVRYQLQCRPNGAVHNFLTSRRVSDVTGNFVEKQDKMPFIRNHKFPWKHTVFDLEIVGEGISSDVCSAIAKGKGECRVFDITFFKGNDVRQAPFLERRELLEKLSREFPDWLRLVSSTNKILPFLNSVIKRGGEGIILKDPNSLYGRGWWKVIHKEYHDCVISGFTMATEKKYKAKGWIKNIQIGQYVRSDHRPKTAKILGSVKRKGFWYDLIDVGHVSSGMDESQRDDFTRRQKKLIGEPIEVSCKQRLPTGRFRSPVFERLRSDKNPTECVFRR